MTSINKLRQRCYIADRTDPDCCWIWRGATKNDGRAAIWLDGEIVGGPYAAVVLSGKSIPSGGRSWATCKNRNCCNPRHAACGTFAEWGAWVRESKLWVGNERNIVAVRARGRKTSKINLQLAREIRNSSLPPTAETRRFKEVHGIEISRWLVYEVRIGKRWMEPSPFAGLGARNA